MRERAIMIEIRAIQEKDYPEVARIWRDVLDIPEDYRSVYYWKGEHVVVYGISGNGYISTAFVLNLYNFCTNYLLV